MAVTADLHTHSITSYDSCNTYTAIIRRCNKIGINCLAVTDHNEISGALQLASIAPFYVIVGEEVNTGEGELIGLFLKERIPPNLGLDVTAEKIKTQGGLVYLPHPLSMSRKSSLNITRAVALKNLIDIVEVFNSRTVCEMEERVWLDEILASDKVVRAAGSDAHSPIEIGQVKISMADFSKQSQFLAALRCAKFESLQKTNTITRLITNHKIRKLLRFLLK
jgi:predicted metal-dependent phosphoesterase TrpH